MDFLQIVLLAILQGLTEFLPISSSAHLILLPLLFDWSDQGLAFDVSVHLGTLLAVILFFRTELTAMTCDWGASLLGRPATPKSRLAWAVLLGTIPVSIAGLLFNESVETILRSPTVIAVTTIGFGLLLWWSDSRMRGTRTENNLTWKDVLIVGLAQALALIPGTSRSGVTMTAGLVMGLNRNAAARYSFLLSIPVILLAGGFKALELMMQNDPVDWLGLALGILISALSAYFCIKLFLKLIERIGMFPFVLYRLILGIGLFILFA